jgi:hypothetical protein
LLGLARWLVLGLGFSPEHVSYRIVVQALLFGSYTGSSAMRCMQSRLQLTHLVKRHTNDVEGGHLVGPSVAKVYAHTLILQAQRVYYIQDESTQHKEKRLLLAISVLQCQALLALFQRTEGALAKCKHA